MRRYTLVIVNWNSWDILSQCLAMLKSQTFQNFNVLVIDNVSHHPAPDGLLSRYPHVTFIQNQSNRGFAAANNQAIALLGDSEWVALLNPDAFPEPDWLRQLIKAAEENPDYSMFASRQLMDGDRHLLDGDGDVYHISGLVWREGHGRHQDKATHAPREVFSPCAAAALYRRDALIAVEGFDEDFFCYVEDVDLGFRLRLMGHRCLLVPSAVVHHMGSATTGGQRSDFSVYHGHRNLVWTFIKNMPGVLFWALLPIHVLLNFVTVVHFAMHGQGKVILRAKRDALKGIPAAWRKRREIQANRRVSVMDIWRVLDKRLTPSRREKDTQPKKGIL
jgi:GT2 family glycosyltransferase